MVYELYVDPNAEKVFEIKTAGGFFGPEKVEYVRESDLTDAHADLLAGDFIAKYYKMPESVRKKIEKYFKG